MLPYQFTYRGFRVTLDNGIFGVDFAGLRRWYHSMTAMRAAVDGYLGYQP